MEVPDRPSKPKAILAGNKIKVRLSLCLLRSGGILRCWRIAGMGKTDPTEAREQVAFILLD